MHHHTPSPTPTRARPRPTNLTRALLSLELGRLPAAAARASATAAAVPSHAFLAVQRVPSAALRRYTPCGRYLVAIDRARGDVRLYLLETGGARAGEPPRLFQSRPLPQLPARRALAGGYAMAARARGEQPADGPRAALHGAPFAAARTAVGMGAVGPAAARAFGGGDGDVGTGTARRQRVSDSVAGTAAVGGGMFGFPASAMAAFPFGSFAVASPSPTSAQMAAPAPASGLLSALPIPPPLAPPPPLPQQEQQEQIQQPQQMHDRQQQDVPQVPPGVAVSTAHTCDFSRFFTHVYTTSIAVDNEVLVPDFCLATSEHLLFATVIMPNAAGNEGVPPPGAAVPAVASMRVVFERISFVMVRTETGLVADRYVLTDDYVALDGHAGVHILGDLLCVLSIRHQTLHLLRMHDATGTLRLLGRIGNHCNPDDELEISRARNADLKNLPPVAADVSPRRRGRFPPAGGGDSAMNGGAPGRRSGTRANVSDGQVSGGGQPPEDRQPVDLENEAAQGGAAAPYSSRTGRRVLEVGLGNGKNPHGFYSGLMHRLLVHVYSQHCLERNERLFFRVIGQYSMLVMRKAQFLDEDHLLIRLGSSGQLVDPAKTTCFFLVYCISTTRIVNLYENRSTELLELYDTHRDLFVADPVISAMHLPSRPWRPHPRASLPASRNRRNIPGNGSVRPGSRSMSPPGGFHDLTQQRTRMLLAELPMSSQERNGSVYLDRRLFSYPVDKLSALDGTRALSMRECMSIKFMAAGGGSLRFKLTPGLPNGETAPDGSGGPPTGRRKVLFLFHPTLPFVISMQSSQAVPTAPLYNFHVRS